MTRAGLYAVLLTVPGLVGLGVLVQPHPAAAQATNFRQEWDDIKNSLPYLGSARDPIDYSERAPLVVPPTNTLPPPSDSPRLGVTDADLIQRRMALSDPRRPVPANDPGASAKGSDARAYLIEPPSGMMNPEEVASEAAAGGFKDNPKKKKKTGLLSSLTKKHHKKADTTAAAATSPTAAQ